MNAEHENPNEEILRNLRRIIELLETKPALVTMTIDGKEIRNSLLDVKRLSGKNLGLS